MASVTRTNPAATATGVEMVGADITFFTIDYSLIGLLKRLK